MLVPGGDRIGVAAIGSLVDIAGFGLVGVKVCAAETAAETRSAWESLPAEIGLVILTTPAAADLEGSGPTARMTVVIPP